MTTKEISLSYRQAILEKHEAGQKADKNLREAILSKIEITRQCGMLLSDAAGDLKNGQFAEATDFLSKDAVQAYIRFAHQNPEPITDLQNALHSIRIALQVSGSLEYPDRHGPQKRHRLNFFSSAESSIQSLAAAWSSFVRQMPLSKWRLETLEGFMATLTPLARIIELVHLEIRNRQ